MLVDVLGKPVTPRGRILFHEHLQFGWPGAALDPRLQWPPPDLQREVQVFHELAEAGFSCFVDATPMECQRDMARLAAVGRKVPAVQIVAATGVYHAKRGFPQHLANLSVEELASLYVAELRGAGTAGPLQAGVIKVATDRHVPFVEREELALRAAALAALETGCRVVSHAESVDAAWRQLEILAASGLPANRVVLGHLDGESGKVSRIVEIARAGAFVGVDRCGHETTTTADQRVELLTLLRAAGVLGHVLLSHDAALRMVDRTGRVESDNPFLRIDRRILPRLRENGFTDRDVDQLLRSNPERFFGIAGRGEGNDEYERGTVVEG